ncbi:unnamed protein product [Kluyveromyces dobzhanskii CBS 2104]|uniref:WGS project CCBQ000000000 data, contig 00099 n=1 Tax=Kluyveromyces dobzhanskii CBS 2104 TaxID=1427455 RepID=A0A0A8L4N5_9SACH|nr:unnamed protein product [Kluyveromyces dobzhanskii CBS 2104]
MAEKLDPIYVVEWEEGADDCWAISDKSGFATHLFQMNEDADKDALYCKHCRRRFAGKERDHVGFHMNKIHPQIRHGMTYNEYLKEFSPVYMPNAHGSEKTMERSFSLALRTYVLCPERSPEVLYFDDVATIIYDKFPKSEQHLLILPRSHKTSNSHPNELSSDIKSQIEWHIDWAKRFCWAQFVKTFDVKDALMSKELFVSNFIQAGIHSIPSMANTHIHVMTKDFHSERLKNKKHFNSFNSPFFVPWENIPSFERRNEDNVMEKFIKNYDLKCPYCSLNFKNQFAKLKVHLADEFDKRFERKTDR